MAKNILEEFIAETKVKQHHPNCRWAHKINLYKKLSRSISIKTRIWPKADFLWNEFSKGTLLSNVVVEEIETNYDDDVIEQVAIKYYKAKKLRAYILREVFMKYEDVCFGDFLTGYFNDESEELRGMPDLIVINPKNKEFFLAEVKTPLDKPSKEQLMWYASHNDVPIKILYIKNNKERQYNTINNEVITKCLKRMF